MPQLRETLEFDLDPNTSANETTKIGDENSNK